MTAERWFELSIFEQMSNIAGEIKRFIDSRKAMRMVRLKRIIPVSTMIRH